MERDKPHNHSNIVSLYDAHRNDRKIHFAYYLPGVGTPFKEIGELEESSSGKSFATGGEARIHWAMLQVYNAVHRAFYGTSLLQEDVMKTMVTKELSSFYRRRWDDQKMQRIFYDLSKRLNKAILGKRPRITLLHLSVFGFSRGAAEARVFCNWIQQICGGVIGEAKVNLRFLGLFDTVASVGLADSSPVGRGFLDWAHNNLAISGIEKTVHYVAGHEIRRSFPLSTVRDGGSWPANTREFVYPGTHSDIGGGYGPGEQGKSLGGRSTLMSQITLNDMYEEAFTAGVRLTHREQMTDRITEDFAIDPAMHAAFMAYTAWTLEANG
ncbi:phospholipase effector Tle1 domain-containing protein, partial [Pseudomonas agarici]|uniref:phospholipase effector Tle1 domain-containing protein n=1 Tax=Pseudomonas agarici TaxID=46677 RepID=UPI00210ACE18